MSEQVECVHVAIEDSVCIITLDRPHVHNAIDEHMLDRLLAVFSEVERNWRVRVAVITGAGEAFVSGGDIAAMQQMSVTEGERFVRAGQDLLTHIERSRVVVIAAINGVALGGGTELALACDIRIASDRAILGLPETTLGLIPGWGGTQRLLRLVGIGRAKHLVLTGRRIDAEEAFRIGLVERVVPHEEVLSAALQTAGEIAPNAPSALAQAKKALNQGASMGLDQALAMEAETWLVNFATPDRVEGLLAFLENRPPAYRTGLV